MIGKHPIVVLLCLFGLALGATDVMPFNTFTGLYTVMDNPHWLWAVFFAFSFGFFSLSWTFKRDAISSMAATLTAKKEDLEKMVDELSGESRGMITQIVTLLGAISIYRFLWFAIDLFLILGYSFIFLTDGVDVVIQFHWVLVVFMIMLMIHLFARFKWPQELYIRYARDPTVLSAIVEGDKTTAKDLGIFSSRLVGITFLLIEFIALTIALIVSAVGMGINTLIATPFYAIINPLTLLVSTSNTTFGILGLIFMSLSWIALLINGFVVYSYLMVVQPFTIDAYRQKAGNVISYVKDNFTRRPRHVKKL